MTGEEMVAAFERAGVRRTEITPHMAEGFMIGIKAERERIAKFVEGLRRDDDSASFYAEFDEARDIIAAKIRAVAT